MFRLVIALPLLGLICSPVHADSFDHYTNQILVKVPAAAGVKKVTKLTPELMVEHSRALPGISGTFLVVKTNDGKLSKLLVQPAQQKIKSAGDEVKTAPILLIERFVTYREGEERTIDARGKMVRLFGGFHFDLDMGQVVPANLGGDLRLVVKGDDSYVEPVGKAEIYLVTRHLKEANPKKQTRPEIGEAFEARYFNGSYKLFDDGRRTGTLILKVGAKNEVSGFYYSGKDGQKYEVAGEVGTPNHSIRFRIMFPKSVQFYRGLMFTGDGQAIVGSSRLQDREMGFYAIRSDE
jgi:hypothetical protein